jgi:hypothetical protein
MSWIDTVLRPLRPSAVAGYCPAPVRVASDLWQLERRLRFPPGLVLSGKTTIVRMRDGGLVLISPVALDEPTAAQVRALGSVAAVVAPNSFHYLFAGRYAAAFPGCTTWLAPGLRERVPTCPSGTVLGDDVRPPWFSELEHTVFGPVRGAAEIVFLHRPTATLILTDLAMNVVTIEPAWQRRVWRASGILPHFGPSRSSRLAFLADRAAAAPHLARILRWQFDRIVLAHGDPVETDGKRRFAAAFRDLR